jgi:two-component system response regulator MprA
MARVLVVEDDETLRATLLRAFRARGHDTLEAADGLAALRLVGDADVVVLDVGLPGVDGLALTRRLRADGCRTPVLLLTARTEVEDRVHGLDAGADDYLPKPFALEELHARVGALVRRRAWDEGAPPERLAFGDLVLDTESMRVARDGNRIELTRTEWVLLELFLRNPDRVLRRAFLLEEVWGLPPGTDSNVVDVYVGYLRRKLEAGGRDRVLQTVRGVGFVLRSEP